MDSHHLRAIILKLQDALSDNDRRRLHFFLGNDVPRRFRDDPTLSGTLSIMESLFDQDKINEQDFTFLINAFDEIQCIDAVKLLREHKRRMYINGEMQSIQSLTSILLGDQDEDKGPTHSVLDNQPSVCSINNATVGSNDVNNLSPKSERRCTPKLSSKIKNFLLFCILLLTIGLAVFVSFLIIYVNRLTKDVNAKDSYIYGLETKYNKCFEEIKTNNIQITGRQTEQNSSKEPEQPVIPNTSATITAIPSSSINTTIPTKWRMTGKMRMKRYEHTASILTNGNVVVIGGINGDRYLDSTEMFNLTTGIWTKAGSMTVGRYKHTASVLANGNVLVTGGFGSGRFGTSRADSGGVLSYTEVYNPSTDVWTTTGSMNVTRFYHTTSVLLNGSVLVAGGYNRNHLDSAELYNPTTGIWTPVGNMIAKRYHHTASVLPNENVLVIGGLGFGGYGVTHLSSGAELYNPSTDVWTTTGSMNVGRHYHSATVLMNGNVLVTGGYDGNALNSAELYDLSTGTWIAVENMNVGRYHHTASLLPNGNVLVTGGRIEDEFNTELMSSNSTELYNPSTNIWTLTEDMTVKRYYHTATVLTHGTVLVTGGFSDTDVLSSAELF